ncbi:PAS domain-containing sensor histidine kinase [Stenotrophomonas oahuensis]|uniref:histidine kinase n=1 Tax=Stenotrophomonas oahuensis TaxID=3003271 RepID=A0ABY9YPF1_9GAMM|nr:ATP-binding protein [Stenotrophomonas sp. A5586]WNH52787.1 ATP-binding protein [Stenotrophomonas sp. A5586]
MNRYRQILEMLDDCIKEIDLDGVVAAVNGRGLKLLGAQHASQVVGKHWRDLWPASERSLIDEALRKASEGVNSEFEAACPDFNGVRRVWRVKVRPITEQGRVESILAVSTDFTSLEEASRASALLVESFDRGPDVGRLELESAMRRERALVDNLKSSEARLLATNLAYQQLEVRHFEATRLRDFAVAAQRAAELILLDAQKGEAVGQMLAGVVHDLNNFLHSATTAVDLVVDSGELTENNLRLLKAAELALQQGAEMSQRLVGFAREHPYLPESVDLHQLVTAMEVLLTQAVGSRAHLVIEPGEATCCAMVDRNTIERALLNLVVNARDACGPEDVIYVRTGYRVVAPEESNGSRSAGRYLTLTVSDTGAGMSEEVLSRIFEVYFTTKRVGEGSGLGLPQVHSAVTQAGGFVTVTSRVGKGTTFELALPRVA